MFRHLLVPLDGSTLAEAAMPAVRHLAEKCSAAVTLLHTIERHAPRAIHGQPHLGTATVAEGYLAELAKRTLPVDRPVQRHVHENKIDDVARSIVEHANELQVDLIVLCTHGAGGIRHGLFGTVAQRVIELGTTPVLLIPTPPSDDRRFSCQRLLVPLDGNQDHEQGLAAAGSLGAGCGEHFLLLMVIPNWRDTAAQSITSRILPGTTAELLDASCAAGQAYLDAKGSEMRNSAREVTATVMRGEPVRAIVAAARDFHADLLVLGTHGKSHIDAFWSGSVTPQLVRKSHLPTLLVPVHDR